jgi:hypothetical protein
MNNNNSINNNSTEQHKLTSQQIQSIFLSAAIPMIGFGFMDNFVMITAGNAIDNSLGVQLGLATMTAAAIGQVVSDVSGVMFGDTLSRVFKISSAKLTDTQRKLAFVRRLRLAGAVLGVITGCTLGATALYFVPDRDTTTNNNESASVSSAATAIHSENGSHPSTRQQQQQLLHRLQKVLKDVMTNQEEKWYSRDARCTLYVNEPFSNCIPVPAPAQNKNSSDSSIARRLSLFGNTSSKANKNNRILIGEGTPAIIDRLVYNRDDNGNKNKDDYSAIMQSAKESRVVVFTNTIYVPVVATENGDNNNSNNNSDVLGVLKVELGQNGGSFYSTGSEIKDAKRVARNLGFFMNHF